MEEKVLARAFIIKMKCPKCNEGYMEQSTRMYPTNPVKYEHMCTKCGHIDAFNKIYPTVEFEEAPSFEIVAN